MTSGSPAAGHDPQIESKLRGLERLHIAGMIDSASYAEMRRRLESSRPAVPAPAPPPAPPAPRPAAYTAPQPGTAAPTYAPPVVAPAPPPVTPDAPTPVPPAPAAAPPPPPVAAPPPPPVAAAPSPAPAAAPPPATPSVTPPAAAAPAGPRWSFGGPAIAPAVEATPPPAPEAPPRTTWSVRPSAAERAAVATAPAAPTTLPMPAAPPPAAAAGVLPAATGQLAPAPWAVPCINGVPAAPGAPGGGWPAPQATWMAPSWQPAGAPAPWMPVPSWQPPAASRSRLPLVILAAVVAVAIAAGAAYGVIRSRSTPSAAVPPGGQVASTGGTAVRQADGSYATVTDFVPDAKAFVEQHRGLNFKHDVTVVALSDADFVARLHGARRAGGGGGGDVSNRIFQALHFIPKGTDLGSLTSSADDVGVEGYYDYVSKELYVRGTKPTPLVRQVVVHELTHAVQDQWFDIAKLLNASSDTESSEARLALVEGDARRIERQYAASMSAADKQQADSSITAIQQQATGIPTSLLVLFSFPYSPGATFADALIAARGQSALDAAFRTPPDTTAEILVPKRYLDNVSPRTVAAPVAPGTALGRDRLGALGFIAMFSSLVDAKAMTASEPQLAAEAWGGDEYVAYNIGSRTCVRDTVVAADPTQARVLNSALKRWIDATPGTSLDSGSLTGTDPVTFTSCTV